MAEKTYRIGEVAAILDVRTSVLRYWEKEFTQLLPPRSKNGQRYYTESNICILRRIQDLLYRHGMKIEGAKKVLEKEVCAAIPPPGFMSAEMEMIENELVSIRDLLAKGKRQ